ncbi:MAG: hypothetical protein RIF42_02510, partial [Parvibaculaceae bacterium]
LEGDGSEVREQLLLAALLLTIFERFKLYIVDQVDGYFSTHTTIKDGNLSYERGQEFKKLINEKGEGQPGQHGNRAFRAALHWFRDLGAISSEEFDDVERIYTLRNDIGHELYLILADDRAAPIHWFDAVLVFAVYLKITRWWVKEVEIATDPDMTPEKYDQIEFESTETMETMLLREIMMQGLKGNQQFEEVMNHLKDLHPNA